MKWPTCLAAVALALAAPEARAQGAGKKYGELLRRIPERANALMLVDVDGLLDSPMGRREKWRDEVANRPTGALGVSGDAARFVVAAGVDLQTLEERWKLGMVETRGTPPPLTVLAAREGGFVEQVETQNVAWTPRNFYLLAFPNRIVGFVAPADRQRLADWLRSTIIKPRTFPAGWADRALFRAEAGSAVVLAVNLDNAIAPKQAEVWLKGLEGVPKARIDPALAAARLASLKSAFLQVDVQQGIEGTLRVEFEDDIDYLAPVAKELILEALDDYGANVDALKRWGTTAKGKTITLSGPLPEEALRHILGVLSAPRLSEGSDSPGAATPAESAKADAPPAPASADAVVKASQRYFRSVTDIVETQKGKQASQNTMKLWYDRAAKQIEELPLLNVDTDLLDWGAKAARSLREIASNIYYAQKDTAYRLSNGPQGSYAGYGYGYAPSVKRDLVKRQYDSVLGVNLDGRWQAIETAIADMRRQMVAKYKVDF